VTELLVGDPKNRGSITSKEKSFLLLQNVHTIPGAHLASYAISTRFLPRMITVVIIDNIRYC
jgi:hypothetical protein